MRVEFVSGPKPLNVEVNESLVKLLPSTVSRTEIEDLYNKTNETPRQLLRNLGVEIIKEANNPTLGIGCYFYLFGQGFPPNHLNYLFKNGQSVLQEPETVALYLDGRAVVHVGWVEANNQKINSKWGYYHICRHDIESVPTSFGDKVIFVKPNEKLKSEIKQNMERVMTIMKT